MLYKAIGAGIVLILALAFGMALVLRQESPSLLEKAKRAGMMPLGEVPIGKQNLDILPLSSSEVLLLTSPGGEQQMKVVDGMSVLTLHAFRVNLGTGVATRVPRLEKAISEWPWFGFRISPDRRYLICQRSDAKRQARLIDLTTNKMRPLVLAEHANVAWLPDSKGFLSITYEGKLETFSTARQFALGDPRNGVPLQVEPPLSWMVSSSAWGPPPAIAPDGSLTVLASYQETRTHPWHQTIRLQQFRKEGTKLVRTATLQFDPPDMAIPTDAVRVSPDGQRLLWHGFRREGNGQESWRLYAANLDGSELRMLGLVPMKGESLSDASSDGFGDPAPLAPSFGAEWMPDSKTICFSADRGIYTTLDR